MNLVSLIPGSSCFCDCCFTSSSGLKSFDSLVRYVGVKAEEHSDELKNLALEDAVKSTMGQKKQLEVHGSNDDTGR